MNFSKGETKPLAQPNEADPFKIALSVTAIPRRRANRRTKKTLAFIEAQSLNINLCPRCQFADSHNSFWTLYHGIESMDSFKESNS